MAKCATPVSASQLALRHRVCSEQSARMAFAPLALGTRTAPPGRFVTSEPVESVLLIRSAPRPARCATAASVLRDVHQTRSAATARRVSRATAQSARTTRIAVLAKYALSVSAVPVLPISNAVLLVSGNTVPTAPVAQAVHPTQTVAATRSAIPLPGNAVLVRSTLSVPQAKPASAALAVPAHLQVSVPLDRSVAAVHVLLLVRLTQLVLLVKSVTFPRVSVVYAPPTASAMRAPSVTSRREPAVSARSIPSAWLVKDVIPLPASVLPCVIQPSVAVAAASVPSQNPAPGPPASAPAAPRHRSAAPDKFASAASVRPVLPTLSAAPVKSAVSDPVLRAAQPTRAAALVKCAWLDPAPPVRIPLSAIPDRSAPLVHVLPVPSLRNARQRRSVATAFASLLARPTIAVERAKSVNPSSVWIVTTPRSVIRARSVPSVPAGPVFSTPSVLLPDRSATVAFALLVAQPIRNAALDRFVPLAIVLLVPRLLSATPVVPLARSVPSAPAVPVLLTPSVPDRSARAANASPPAHPTRTAPQVKCAPAATVRRVR